LIRNKNQRLKGPTKVFTRRGKGGSNKKKIPPFGGSGGGAWEQSELSRAGESENLKIGGYEQVDRDGSVRENGPIFTVN